MQIKNVLQEVARSQASVGHVQVVMIVTLENLHSFKTEKKRSINTLYFEAFVF